MTDTLILISGIFGGLLVLAVAAGLAIGAWATRSMCREDVADATARAESAERAATEMAARYDSLAATPHGVLIAQLADADRTIRTLLARIDAVDSGPIDALMNAVQAPPTGDTPAENTGSHRRRRPAAARPYVGTVPPPSPAGPGHD